jgi:hypothetical protein
MARKLIYSWSNDAYPVSVLPRASAHPRFSLENFLVWSAVAVVSITFWGLVIAAFCTACKIIGSW